MAEYEVETIKSKRVKNGRTEYEIKWKGYDSDDCTWEPEDNLSTCKEMLDAFNKKHSTLTPKVRNTSAQKTALKSVKFKEAPKMKKKPYNEDSEELFGPDEDQEEQTRPQMRPRKIAPAATNPKKGSRFVAPINPPRNSRSRAAMSAEEVIDSQISEEGPGKVNSNKLGEASGVKVKVLGMMKGKDNTFYFKVKQGIKTEIMSRDELIGKEPLALVLFYEHNLIFK